MRLGAVIAGITAALLALALSGCAALRAPRSARKQVAAIQTAQGRELSRNAQAAIDNHDDAAALAFLTQLAAIEPRSAEVQNRLGGVLQQLGRNAEAEAAYRKALGLDREYVGALIGLGSIEAAVGRPQEALKRFDDALEIDPHQAGAHLGRAHALESLGNPDDALAAYFRVLEFAPNSTDARLRVSVLQLAANAPDQALTRLDTLVEQDPDNLEARFQRGRAHLALNHNAQARDDLQLAVAKLPNRPDILYNLALALAAHNETKAALAAADQALRLAPDYADARTLSAKLRR